jgi:hypothetical protein
MKKILLTSAFLISAVLFSALQAQPEHESGKCSGCAITKMKREYIEKNFEIRDDIRAKFWEVYDQIMQEEIKVHATAHLTMEKIGVKRVDGRYNFEEMTEDQIIAFYDSHFEEKSQIVALNNKFYQEIKNILNPKEIVKYYSLEKNFKKTMANHADAKANADKKGAAKNVPQAMPVEKTIKIK